MSDGKSRRRWFVILTDLSGMASLCTLLYISLFLSVISIRFPWLADCVLYEYLIGVSHHAHSTASTLAQLLTIDRPLFFFLFQLFLLFYYSANFFACLFHSDALRLNRTLLSNNMWIAELFTFLEGNLGGHGLRPMCAVYRRWRPMGAGVALALATCGSLSTL